MREGQVPPARAGTREEGQGETERKRGRKRERETEGPARAQRGASSGVWRVESPVAAPGLAPPGGHPGWGTPTGPSWGREKKGLRGRAGHISMVQVRTKCELGVSIGNSAFTFLLHFYFKHRKRERKQIEKKCARKKKRKKRLNCFRFLSGNMPPFPFFPHPGSPTPKRSISSAPTPKSLPLGRVLGGDSHREGETREDRDQERHGVRGVYKQAGGQSPQTGGSTLSALGAREGVASAGR